MQTYYGAKLIHAEPANKGVDEGYFVKYEDGYTSWSPKEVFEKAYRPVEGLPFGLALEAMKQGKKLYRASWPKVSKYLTYHPPVCMRSLASMKPTRMGKCLCTWLRRLICWPLTGRFWNE